MLAVFGLVAAIAAAQPAAAIAETFWAVGDGATATGPAGGLEDDMLGDFIAAEPPFDRFLYLGDVYQTGTAFEFSSNYDSAFGAFRDITSPTPGDNEWPNVATGYDPYWGTLAPRTSSGGRYYSFDVGGWHVISLNSNESASATSAQLGWLRDDLARAEYDGTCTIAIIHEPRYFASEATSPDRYGIEPLWAALEGHAVAVLSGHIHNYQRLVPEGGITQFVVGTGGRQNRALDADPAGQVAAGSTRTGALRLDLDPGVAEYDFFGLDGRTTLDSGTLACRPHASTPAPPPPASPKPPAPPPPPPPPPAASPAPAPAPAAAEAPVFRSPVAAPSSIATTTPAVRISLRGPARASSRRGFTVTGRSQGARRAIRLSLIRRVGRRCEAFGGRRFRRSSCRARAVLVASGRESFRYRFRRPLPRGTYLLSARAVDGLGVSAWASRRLTVR